MCSNLVALGILFALPALGAALACCSQLPTCVDANNCTAYQDAGDGSSDALPDVVVPPGCDLAKSPKESPACVSDDVGVFVSPQGKDGATGKKTDPLRSIAEAVGKGKPRVYVCEGTYDANVAITTPVAIYGGLTCLWDLSDASRPKLAPPKGIALRVTKVTGAVDVEDLDIVGAADANTPGDSAIAAFASESQTVTFRRVKLSAGGGTGGPNGVSRSNYAGAMATKGGDALVGAAGGQGPVCTCTDGTSSTGGNGGSGGGGGLTNGSASPPVGVANSGGSKATSCDPGLVGANGTPGAIGQPLLSAGALSSAGWTSDLASNSAPAGRPAQGGGGGGTKLDSSTPGGGGGCGGCGGAGGASGRPGGSSFALLVFNSNVTIAGGALTTAGGGGGGTGGGGQDGQGGGGAGTANSCNGGPGGSGAGGSGGAGGPGGHSVPIAFVGPEPKATDAALTPGVKGGAGAPGGGAGSAGAAGTPGPEGKSQNTLAL